MSFNLRKNNLILLISVVLMVSTCLIYMSYHNKINSKSINERRQLLHFIGNQSILTKAVKVNNPVRISFDTTGSETAYVLEVDELNIHAASLYTQENSTIICRKWLRCKPNKEFNLNTKPYFKLNKQDLNRAIYLHADQKLYRPVSYKLYTYFDFVKKKNIDYLLRSVKLTILFIIIFCIWIFHFKLNTTYSLFILLYSCLWFGSSMLYRGFTYDFWPFTITYFADHIVAIFGSIHLIIASTTICKFITKGNHPSVLKITSCALSMISFIFLVLSIFLNSYHLLRYQLWFSLIVGFVYLALYPIIFKRYNHKKAYLYNYYSIITFLILILSYVIRDFINLSQYMIVEIAEKILFIGHILTMFYAFILINFKKISTIFKIPIQVLPREETTFSYEEDSVLAKLSEREYEILQLIAEGMKDQEIANKLFLSLSTVKTHKQKMYRKLDINNRSQAVNIFLRFKSKEIIL